MFLEPPLLFSHFTRLFVHLSLHIYHMINKRKDTARTHRCPVGLVFFFFALLHFVSEAMIGFYAAFLLRLETGSEKRKTKREGR